MDMLGCLKTVATNYQSAPFNIPKDHHFNHSYKSIRLQHLTNSLQGKYIITDSFLHYKAGHSRIATKRKIKIQMRHYAIVFIVQERQIQFLALVVNL